MMSSHPDDDFGPGHALVVGPLIYQHFMARDEITDELIELTVSAYLHSR